MLKMLTCTLLFIVGTAAFPTPYAHFAPGAYANRSTLTVDLGYGRYQGWHNDSADLDIFQGIRFAQSTTGKLRWQAPRAPEADRDSLIQADTTPAQCPQSPSASSSYTPANNTGSSEDCLFVNVFAPSGADTKPDLPVLVWIHGGGYGQGSGISDLTALITNNNNSFVGVTIQYRLGAFGFLSSDEVYRKGVANAGLLDQHLALQWVQQYIHLFGGDNTRVTIFGESAGGGSVMLIAYGGTLGTSLFRNSISASPYLPFQYGYKDWQPSQAYYAFATAAGCDTKNAYLQKGSKSIFDCLVEADAETLMNASSIVSQSGSLATWGFLPVTDGKFIQDLPSKQLARGNVNGLNQLSGHNALEGAAFVTWNITTITDLVEYLQATFPMFSNNDIAKVLRYYPTNNASVDQNDPTWATEGDSGVTSLNQSTAATGQKQRANAIYGETTFICPSYWLAEAYSNNVATGGKGWKYQFSIPNAYHGADGAGYFGWPYTSPYYSSDYILAFMKMLGNFIVNDSPSIPNNLANGLSTGNASLNPASEWPEYSIYDPLLMDFNTTCPSINIIGGLPYCTGPGEMNTFRLANAYTWEGGQGVRCDFWKSLGELVPE